MSEKPETRSQMAARYGAQILGAEWRHIICEAGADWVRPIDRQEVVSFIYHLPDIGIITLKSPDIDTPEAEEAALVAQIKARRES